MRKVVSFACVLDGAHAEMLTAVTVCAFSGAGAAEHKLRERHVGLLLQEVSPCLERSLCTFQNAVV